MVMEIGKEWMKEMGGNGEETRSPNLSIKGHILV
jgi:hypothetical protein